MPTASYMDDCSSAFSQVHGGFEYVPDEEQHGRREDWRLPEDCGEVTGDCDDFAIACRELLQEQGHRPRLLFCKAETGEGHLICVLGKMALDNRMDSPVEILSLVERGYTLVSVSGTQPGDPWREIEDAA